MLKVVASLICFAGIVEYYAHKYMEPYISKNIKSYHVALDNIFLWPAASHGNYCKDYAKAHDQFNKYVRYGPQIGYKIVAYPAAVTGFLFPRIIGISDEEGKIIKQNKQ